MFITNNANGKSLKENRRKVIGFLSPSKIDPQAILPTLDWANEMSQRDDVIIVGGFSSKLEREVLSILLSGKCKIHIMLARRAYVKLPIKWQKAVDEKRLLVEPIVSSEQQDLNNAHYRNEMVVAVSEELVLPCRPKETSSLAKFADLLETHYLFVSK